MKIKRAGRTATAGRGGAGRGGIAIEGNLASASTLIGFWEGSQNAANTPAEEGWEGIKSRELSGPAHTVADGLGEHSLGGQRQHFVGRGGVLGALGGGGDPGGLLELGDQRFVQRGDERVGGLVHQDVAAVPQLGLQWAPSLTEGITRKMPQTKCNQMQSIKNHCTR